MTIVKVMPGPCGFEAKITAETVEKYQVRLDIESACPAVAKMSKELTGIDIHDLVGRKGFGRSRPHEIAARTLAHGSCPILSAVLKAAEVEMGLAIPRPVIIQFSDGDGL